MAYNKLEFDATIQPMGQKYALKEDLGRTIKIVLTKPDFQFATQSEAETESNWQDAIDQEEVFPMPFVYENEDVSGEAVYQDFAGGDSLKVRDGNQAEKLKLHLSVADMRKLQSYKNKSWRMFIIDENGNILGTSPDSTVFKGFELTTFEVEKMNVTIGDVKRMVPIYYKFREINEWLKFGIALRPLDLSSDAFDPRDFDGLTDVELTINSQTSSKIIVNAEAYLKGVALPGFDEVTDWVLLDSSGDAQTITTVTDNSDGTYDLEGTGLVTGTLDLAEPEDLSQDGYKSTGAVDVTIS